MDETDRILDVATRKQNADILIDVCGHPEEAPSLDEIDYLNPDIDKDELRERLTELEEAEILHQQTVDDGSAVWALSTEAREVFDENDLFPREALRRQYDSVARSG